MRPGQNASGKLNIGAAAGDICAASDIQSVSFCTETKVNGVSKPAGTYTEDKDNWAVGVLSGTLKQYIVKEHDSKE